MQETSQTDIAKAMIKKHALSVKQCGELMGMRPNALSSAINGQFKLSSHRVRLLLLELGETVPWHVVQRDKADRDKRAANLKDNTPA